MLNKEVLPNACEINKFIGKKANTYVNRIIANLRQAFNLQIELKFPFGNNYGWGYKLNIGSKHLLYVFFEDHAITIMIQLKKIATDFAKTKYEELSNDGKQYWGNRYPCGDGGGWIHYRVLNDEHFSDIGKLIMIKLGKELEWLV